MAVSKFPLPVSSTIAVVSVRVWPLMLPPTISEAPISEIGASMMVGGNIKGQTRTLTTAMVLETSKGNFDVAIALALLLLVLIFLVNWGLTVVQQRRAP